MLAIVLSRHDFRENDQIISLYTLEKGKIEVLARGIKKIISKNSACLEPFFVVEAEIIKGRELDRLASVQPIESFDKIRTNLLKSAMAGAVVGLVKRLLRGEEKETKIFYLLRDWLVYINKNVQPAKNLIIVFLVKFLVQLGFVPVLDRCSVCGKHFNHSVISNNGQLFFNPIAGGIMCSSCSEIKRKIGESSLILSGADIGDWEKMLNNDWNKIPVVISFDLMRVIYIFAEHYSETKIEKELFDIL